MYSSVVLMLVLATLAVVASSQESPEVLPFENIDVDNVLKNDKLITRYIDCVLGRGRCDKNGEDLKVMIPRVLNENCRGCTPTQITNSNRIISFMESNHPGDWAQIRVKYSTS